MDKMKKMLKKRGLRRIGGKRGFTLIELLIVMSIIAVLVAIVVMSLVGFLGAGEGTVCEADGRSLQSAVMAFFVHEGATATSWPTTTGVAGEDILWSHADDDGDVFVDEYILTIPQSSDDATENGQPGGVGTGGWDCVWGIDANGIITVAEGINEAIDCPCAD